MIRRDYVPEDELWSLLAACDAVVSLRWPTMGETSAAAVRALSLGKPLVVSDVGAFRELPDEAVVKVPVGEGEIAALVAAIERAASEPRDGATRRCALARDEHRLERHRRPLRRRAPRDRGSGGGGMKVAYYSPMPPSRSGIADYSALLLPELEKRIDVVVAKPGRRRRNPAADIALYHVGNDAEAHGWIVDALRKRPGVVVLHDFVLHHLVVGLTFARGDSAGYLAAMEREDGLVGRLLAYAVLDNKLPPLWETRPEDFPLAGEILALATGLIVHSHYVERRARETGFTGPIARIPHPAWPIPELAPAAVDGDPLFGCFGHLNETKRIAELVSAFARAARAAARRAPPARRLARRATRPARAARGRDPSRLRPRGRALVADGRLRRDRLAALADDGRDVRQRDPRALARQAAGGQRRRLVRRAARRRGDQGARRRAREEHACSPRSKRSPTRPSAPRWASAPASSSSASTGSTWSPRRTRRRWSGWPAARRVDGRVLHEIASAAAEVGMDGDDAAVLAARLREVGLGE